MGPGISDIAEIIPEIRWKLPNLESPPSLDPEQARFRLFHSIAAFLKNAAKSQPLMFVLDDLHWADKPSLLLLEFMAPHFVESPLLMLGTYRDVEVNREHPLSESLSHLYRSPAFRTKSLSGLEPEEVRQFIQTISGSDASDDLVDAIYSHTEGNPFFMSEVIRLLSEQDELGEGSSAARQVTLVVPRSVLEVIGERLNRLSAECNDILSTAAAIGRQFDFNLLVSLTEKNSEIQSMELVEEALEARVVQESQGQKNRYQSSHALVHQTLLERISTSRRVRLHARIGEMLETLYGNEPGGHAAESAYHFSEALPVAGPEKLVKYSAMAGEVALEGYAHEEALQHFQKGLVAKGVDLEGTIPGADAESAALLLWV